VQLLLFAVWILLSAGSANAGWDEVMDALEQASGPVYDMGADPAEPEWVATRKARFEGERARIRGANLKTDISRDRNGCEESSLAGHGLRCE
jgi:hypothetical protein